LSIRIATLLKLLSLIALCLILLFLKNEMSSITNSNANANVAATEQRKKKTYPVFNDNDTGCEQISGGVAETLIGIMQAPPVIKAPIRKKKAPVVSVATIVDSANTSASSAMQCSYATNDVANSEKDATTTAVKKRKPKAKPAENKEGKPETNIPIITENTIAIPPEQVITGDALVEPVVPIIANEPKVKAKRAPKKKTDLGKTESPNTNNVETPENTQQNPIEEAEVAIAQPAEIIAPISTAEPKAKAKRAPKKKTDLGKTESPNTENVENVETPENAQQNPIEEPIVPISTNEPKAKAKRAPKKKTDLGKTESPKTDNVENVDTHENTNEIPQPNVLGEIPTTPENTQQIPNEEPIVPISTAEPKAKAKRAPKKKTDLGKTESPKTDNVENVETPENIQQISIEEAEAAIAQPAEVVAPISTNEPKAKAKRVYKRKPVLAKTESPNTENVENVETHENTNEIPQPNVLGEIPMTPENAQQNPIEEPIAPIIAAEPKAKAKRVYKRKTDLAKTESLKTDNVENVETPDNAIEIPIGEQAAPIGTNEPKAKAKRVYKRKTDLGKNESPNTNNVETPDNAIENPIGEPIAPISAAEPKAKAKRASKKKTDLAKTESPKTNNVENVETPENTNEIPQPSVLGEIPIITPAINNALDSLFWISQREEHIQLTREPILATFQDINAELQEELYLNQDLELSNKYESLDTSLENAHALQPIDSIIANTLENSYITFDNRPEEPTTPRIISGDDSTADDDYNEIVMVESLMFNGELYFVDTENRLLNKETFAHIGQYYPESQSISLW
jgi:hypothetical protein